MYSITDRLAELCIRCSQQQQQQQQHFAAKLAAASSQGQLQERKQIAKTPPVDREFYLDNALAEWLEAVSQKLVSYHIKYSLHMRLGSLSALSSAAASGLYPAPALQSINSSNFLMKRSAAVVARACVRIDLAGGWSDTPPCCYETAGSVFNVGVLVDGVHPVACGAQFIRAPVICLRDIKPVIGSKGRYETSHYALCQRLTDFDSASWYVACTHTYIYKYTYKYVYTYTHIRIHINIHAYIYVNIYTYMQIHIYTNTRTQTHTNTIQIHTHALAHMPY